MSDGEKVDKPASQASEVYSYIRVRIIDGRAPFPVLALFNLVALPRPGDLINIQTSTGNLVGYKVEFINFNPFQEYQVTIGCLPPDAPSASVQLSATELKDRMDTAIKAQLQIFDRAQAYSNAMIVAGYAGVFGLWSFTKANLTSATVDIVALLVGVSLVLYVAWEIYGMVLRANAANRFQKLLGHQPTEFFNLLTVYENESRVISMRAIILWRIVVLPTIVLAYTGGLLLLYNVAANLFRLHPWP